MNSERKFDIITSQFPQDLVIAVNHKLQEGWSLNGPTVIHQREDGRYTITTFYQPIKYEGYTL